MYFCLHEYCKLVEGAKRGAIYNLRSGKVLSINEGALKLLMTCQNNAFEDIADNFAQSPYMNFLQDLITKDLGKVSLTKPEPQHHLEALAPKKLNSIVMELTSRCNNTCQHCYTSSSPSAPGNFVPHERWLSFIKEARLAGADEIQLIGGEPLLYPHWRELVLKARAESFQSIEIFTNATLITDKDIEFFKNNNIIISTSIYAGNAEIHDQVTLNPGSFDKTIANIHKILDNGIMLRIYSVIMKTNESELDNIIKLCAELGLKGIAPPAVRPVGRGANEKLSPQTYTSKYIKPPFYTNQYSFTEAHTYHCSLAGTITITFTGDATACIFARNDTFGNILTSSLNKILANENLNKVWHTTKNHVEKCRDCEYRFACLDCRCRPITQNANTSKRPACPTNCSYNPYSGEWADEKLKPK